jgi:hypothetical protein
MTLAEANVKFSSTGSDQVKTAADGIGKSLDSVAKKAENAGVSIKNIAAGNIVSNIIQRLADGAFDLGKNILEMGMSFQTTNAQFEALGMNANTTRDFITKVAAASTLTTKELTGLATSVQLSGFNIYRVLPAFAKLADLAGKDQDKLQGMVRLLNVLKTGARPDQELLQSLKMPTLLSDAGLKFDKGKLVGDIDAALEAVIKAIEGKTGKVSKAMNKTFEASFSSLVDQFDKLKETLGSRILDFAKPLVDSLTVVLKALTSSGTWDRFLNQFFLFGDAANKNLRNGLLNKETLFAFANFITQIISNIAFIPARFDAIFKLIGPAVKEFFSNLKEDPTIRGLLSVFEKIGNIDKAAADLEKYKRTSQKLYKEGIIKSPNVLSRQEEQIVRMQMAVDAKKGGAGALASLAEKNNAISEQQRKFYERESLKLRSNILGMGLEPPVVGKGKVTLPGTKLGDDTQNGKDKDKNKKTAEKQTNLLDLIVQNTSKANELTLRNMTYGGGQLAAQGISAVQMSNYRSVASPRINATNDISRGVKKEVNATTNSNFLNFSARRS